MIRVNIQQQVLHFIVFLLIQIPFLYKLILFNSAFGFFYIGFILFLPYALNRSLTMVIAFLTGLIIDVFSNTPGIHASACILVAFMKDSWFNMMMGTSDDDVYLDWNELKIWGSIKYLLPLIFIHHTIIFAVENGGFNSFGFLFSKIIYSSLYSFIIVYGLSFLMAPKARRI